jgi:hypothetical protein
MSPTNEVCNWIDVDVRFSQDILNGILNEEDLESRMKNIIGSSTRGYNRYEIAEIYDGRNYYYHYLDEENTEDDEFSLEYATTFIHLTLEHLKNNPMVEWFRIICRNTEEQSDELYRYERTTG